MVAVSVQPLASNVRRVIKALDALGHPLLAQQRAAIITAINAQDFAAIQQAVDNIVLAVVTINPEERVSAQRGPVGATLQQGGYRPMLVKVVNHSTSTARLRVYARARPFAKRCRSPSKLEFARSS